MSPGFQILRVLQWFISFVMKSLDLHVVKQVHICKFLEQHEKERVPPDENTEIYKYINTSF